jgi:hypothetical protein
MPSSMYDAYAEKICRHVGLPADQYESNQLNDVILTLPLGEGHAIIDGIELEKLPRLGESLTLKDHMQRNFFEVVGHAGRELYEFTTPFIIRRSHLERLDGWREWRTLAVYMSQHFLQPVLVFRNTPMPTRRISEIGLVEAVDYYVGEVRVIFSETDPFVWKG